MRSLALPLLAAGVLGCASAAARQTKEPSPQAVAQTAQRAPGAAAAAPGAKSALKDFKELTKDAVAREGFFDAYEKEGRV